jgi:hypothetical protein
MLKKSMSVLAMLGSCAGILFLAGSAAADEQVDCAAFVRDVPVESKVATASTYSNFRNSEGSLRFESKRMFQGGTEAMKTLAPPADLCPAGCVLASPASMVLKATPKQFLQDYSERKECERFLAATRERPFVYKDRVFADLEAFLAWYNDFSTGSGPDGEDLYRRCPGSCSPQYSTAVTEAGGKLNAAAQVICGPARDKSDNQYNLSFGFRWSCEKADK